MTATPTPRQILETLLPSLRLAAGYARQIQSRIVAQPGKGGATRFSDALTDADLSIQTFVEVALLGAFPSIRFYGEEYEKSYNTKYFRAIALGPAGDYLVTLDPIDGTLFYLDGHPNYQIILTVMDTHGFEAVIAVSPAQDRYYYALHGEGTRWGQLSDNLADCQRLQINPQPILLLGTRLAPLKPKLCDRYRVISVAEDYSRDIPIPNVNGILTGELGGAAIASGKFIDGAALAFLAQEAGYFVTTHDGSALPPANACEDYSFPGLAIAATPQIQADLLDALRTTPW